MGNAVGSTYNIMYVSKNKCRSTFELIPLLSAVWLTYMYVHV